MNSHVLERTCRNGFSGVNTSLVKDDNDSFSLSCESVLSKEVFTIGWAKTSRKVIIKCRVFVQDMSSCNSFKYRFNFYTYLSC